MNEIRYAIARNAGLPAYSALDLARAEITDEWFDILVNSRKHSEEIFYGHWYQTNEWRRMQRKRAERSATIRAWNFVPGAGCEVQSKPDGVTVYGLIVPHTLLNGERCFDSSVLIVGDDLVAVMDTVCWLPKRITPRFDGDEPFVHNANGWGNPSLLAELGRPRKIWRANETYHSEILKDKYFVVVYYPAWPDEAPQNFWSRLTETEFNVSLLKDYIDDVAELR